MLRLASDENVHGAIIRGAGVPASKWPRSRKQSAITSLCRKGASCRNASRAAQLSRLVGNPPLNLVVVGTLRVPLIHNGYSTRRVPTTLNGPLAWHPFLHQRIQPFAPAIVRAEYEVRVVGRCLAKRRLVPESG
jgi:hypothetical protein